MYIRSGLFVFLLSLSIPTIVSGQEMKTHDDLYFFLNQRINEDSSYHFTIKPYLPTDSRYINQTVDSKKRNNVLYKISEGNLIEYSKNAFSLSLNPILTTEFSIDQEKGLSQDFKYGISVKSKLKDKLFFVSDLFYGMKDLTNESAQFADSFGIIPHYSKYINKSGLYYNYFNLTGELVYAPVKSIYFHIGRGKHFFGNGYRSLFLSDNSAPYPFFKTSVDIWRIKYVWMFSMLRDFEVFYGEFNNNLYDKAAFIHYLSLNISKHININFFESIITNPYDLVGRRKSYEISYFNPLVFYRPVEFYTGSSDNALLGLGLNIKLRNRYFFYSQFILDDLVISSLKEKNGWWGNKFGIQAGIKGNDIFKVKGFFFRYEFNAVKPYTYSHGLSYSKDDIADLNYGNYRQALAHPAGGNFVENIIILKYIRGRLLSQFKYIFVKKGDDIDEISYGGDIYKAYDLRNSDYDVFMLRGNKYKMNAFELSGQYLINPEFDLFFILRTGFISSVSGFGNENILFVDFGFSTKIFNEEKRLFK